MSNNVLGTVQAQMALEEVHGHLGKVTCQVYGPTHGV